LGLKFENLELWHGKFLGHQKQVTSQQKSKDFRHLGVSLNGGTPKTPQNHHV